MTPRVEFHVAAHAEVDQASVYYESREPGLGDFFLEDLRRVVSRISEYPEVGRRS